MVCTEEVSESTVSVRSLEWREAQQVERAMDLLVGIWAR